MEELWLPMLMLTNALFVTKIYLLSTEARTFLSLPKLCTIHDRERNRMKFSKIEESKFPTPMLTNIWFVMQNSLVG